MSRFYDLDILTVLKFCPTPALSLQYIQLKLNMSHGNISLPSLSCYIVWTSGEMEIMRDVCLYSTVQYSTA